MEYKEYSLLIFLLTLITIFMRSFFFLFGKQISLSEKLRNRLEFVPAITLASVLAPELISQESNQILFWFNSKFFTVLLSALCFFYTRSLILTLAFGLCLLEIINFLFRTLTQLY